MKEALIIFTYTFIIAFIAINLNKAMPYMKQRWNAFITSIKRKSNAPKQSSTDKVMIEKMITKALREKVNSGMFTYHRKQAIKEIVREEVINYLNELKNK
jgi:hypothetical protein